MTKEFKKGDRVSYKDEPSRVGTVVGYSGNNPTEPMVYWDEYRAVSTVWYRNLVALPGTDTVTDTVDDDDLLEATEKIVNEMLAEIDSGSTSVVRLSIAVHGVLTELTDRKD